MWVSSVARRSRAAPRFIRVGLGGPVPQAELASLLPSKTNLRSGVYCETLFVIEGQKVSSDTSTQLQPPRFHDSDGARKQSLHGTHGVILAGL